MVQEEMAEDSRIAAWDKRHEALKKMSDDQLKARFWELCEKAVAPMVELGKTYTSPSIERAVLLRMGIDSVSTKGVVQRITEAGLLGKGAGNCVLRVSQKFSLDAPAAAKRIIEDKTVLDGLFGS
jgi:D-ornithine 4,5-aminomutase subunit alpha